MSPNQLQFRLELVDLLLQGAHTHSLLEQVCRCLEAPRTGLHGCILLADAGNSCLYGCAAPSLPSEFKEALTRVPIAAQTTPWGKAACSKRRWVVDHILQEPDCEALQPIFQRAGLEGCWCEPVLDSDGRLLGVFSVLSGHGRLSDVTDINLLEDGAYLTRFTLERASWRRHLLERACQAADLAVRFCDSLDSQPPAPAVERRQPLVMIIDDEPMLARMLGKLVKMQGYETQVFTDSTLAWSQFVANPAGYSALITDQKMPGRTGDAFARDALALRPDLPILLCTGFSEQINAEAAHLMGIRYFLQKPIKPAVLFKALASAVAGQGILSEPCIR